MLKNKLPTLAVLTSLSVASFSSHALDVEMRGYAGLEGRVFFENPAYPGQKQHNASFVLNPEFFYGIEDSSDSVNVSLFARVDNADEERTHADIRELNYLHVADDYELRVGIGKVFWGVTEGQHLVDIVNQTDLIENLDGEDKLGQAMVNLTWLKHQDYGVFDAFLLPGFRERTFSGEEGRLRPGFVVDGDNARYEASNGQAHTDIAFRWAHSFDIYDVGVSYFNGTRREPILEFEGAGLRPFYPIVNQIGIDAQASLDGWLLKLEAITQSGNIRQTPTLNPFVFNVERQRYTALTTGFEYTLVGIMDSDKDLGLIAEWNYDDRRNQDNPGTTFQNDLLIGTRWVYNDAESTEILAGVLQDLEYDTTSITLEASTRLTGNLKLTVEGRVFAAVDSRDTLAQQIEDDSHLLAQVDYFF